MLGRAVAYQPAPAERVAQVDGIHQAPKPPLPTSTVSSAHSGANADSPALHIMVLLRAGVKVGYN